MSGEWGVVGAADFGVAADYRQVDDSNVMYMGRLAEWLFRGLTRSCSDYPARLYCLAVQAMGSMEVVSRGSCHWGVDRPNSTLG